MKKALFPRIPLVLGVGLALVALLASFAPPAGSALAQGDPQVCVYKELGTEVNLTVGIKTYRNQWVGLFRITVDGVSYDGWCIDLEHGIRSGQCFDATLTDASRETLWCEIGYIMTNYSPGSGDEAAAIQLALWKCKYGKNYVKVSHSGIESSATAIYTDAQGKCPSIIGLPSDLTLQPDGDPVVNDSVCQQFTATVTGSGSLEGIAIEFSTTNGSLLPPDTVPTDANGEASVTLCWDGSSGSFEATLRAHAEGDWPVIIYPTGSIQETIILQHRELSAEESIAWQQEVGTITAHKFNDLNGDGIQAATGEGDLAGWTMNLYSGSGCSGTPLQTLVTDGSGNAVFTGLAAGDYSVGETLQAGWTNTTPLCVNITLPAGGSETAEFGNETCGLRIIKKDWDTGDIVNRPGLIVRITPHPYTGTGYLEVEDNVSAYDKHTDGYGTILLLEIRCDLCYKIEEVQAPDGYNLDSDIVENVCVSSIPDVFLENTKVIEVEKTAILCEEGDGEGCTPGYWKNHEEDWPPTGYSPSQTVGDVFVVPDCVVELAGDTLLTALQYGGGDDVLGMAQNLLRIGVAALLNAAHPGVNYPRAEGDVIAAVDGALASCDRDTMETVKNDLSDDNELGCPLGEDPANPDNAGDACCPDCCPGDDPLNVNVGDTVMYCYEVTNTSTNGVTLTGITVIDDLYGPVTLDTTTLGPGDSARGTLTHVVVEDDIPSVTNTASATGTPDGGAPITVTDTCTVNIPTFGQATITGYKFRSDECIGTPYAVEGWEIELWKINLSDGSESYVATAYTDINGQFTFEDVAAGIYKVVEEQRLPDWVPCLILPLRTCYVVIVTEVDATDGNEISLDVYDDALCFVNWEPPD